MTRGGATTGSSRASGFTLMELLVTMTVMALIFAMVVPNLGAFVPEAKLDGSAKQLVSMLDWVRSEARIQGRRMSVDLDLKRARWRVVHPPELQLTRDQDLRTLEEYTEDWRALEQGVVFAGAGDARTTSRDGVYRITFDEHGFAADQVVVLRMAQDEKLVWSLLLHGLSGRMSIERSLDGAEAKLENVNEGAF